MSDLQIRSYSKKINFENIILSNLLCDLLSLLHFLISYTMFSFPKIFFYSIYG